LCLRAAAASPAHWFGFSAAITAAFSQVIRLKCVSVCSVLHRFVYLFRCLFGCSVVCLFACLLVCLFVCLFVCLYFVWVFAIGLCKTHCRWRGLCPTRVVAREWPIRVWLRRSALCVHWCATTPAEPCRTPALRSCVCVEHARRRVLCCQRVEPAPESPRRQTRLHVNIPSRTSPRPQQRP
jgi:hypothetical protein